MQPHPLFQPQDEDDEMPEVEFIHVTRFEGSAYLWCPYRFGPEEIADLSDVFERFGGGKYELIARNGGKLSAKRRYELPGKPRPLTGISEQTDAPTQSPPVAPPANFGDSQAGVIMQMMTLQSENNRLMMQMMMQSSQQTMTAMTSMTTAMLSRDGDASKTLIQALQANNERAIQGQSQVFQTMLETIGKGASGGKSELAAFKEGLEIGSTAEGDDGDSVVETLGQVAQGLGALNALTGNGPPLAEIVQ